MGGRVPAARDLPSLGFLHPVDHPLEQVDLVFPEVLRSAFLHPGEARGEAGDAEHVGRAALEEIGVQRGLRLARRVASRAPFAPGADLAVRARADIERTGPRWTVQGLVAGEGEEIDRR